MKKRSWFFLLASLVVDWEMTVHVLSWLELLQYLSFPVLEKMWQKSLACLTECPWDKQPWEFNTQSCSTEMQPLKFGVLSLELETKGCQQKKQLQQLQETQQQKERLSLKSLKFG